MRKSISSIFLLCLVVILSGQSCVSFTGSGSNTNAGPVGMFMSSDKGETWKQMAALPTNEGVKSIATVGVYRIVDDPQDQNAMYLASRDNGILYTYDNAETWQKVKGPLSSGFVYSLAVHPKNKCIIFATNGKQVFRSDDCTRTWAEMYREARGGVVVTSLAFNQFAPYQIYLAEQNGDLLESYDSGNSWTVNRRFGENIGITTSPLKEGLIYAITKENGFYRSDDGGKTWNSYVDKLKDFSQAKKYRKHLLHPTKPDTIFWISTYGILRSDDRGETWKAMDLITPPGSADIYAFAINPKNENEIFYTATISDRSTFYKSLDGGKNWITKKLPSGQIPIVLRFNPKDESKLFLGFTYIPKKK